MDKILDIYLLLPTINSFVMGYPNNDTIFTNNKFITFCLQLTSIDIYFSSSLLNSCKFINNNPDCDAPIYYEEFSLIFRQYILSTMKLCPNVVTLSLSSSYHKITLNEIRNMAEEILLFYPYLKLQYIYNSQTKEHLCLDTVKLAYENIDWLY